MILTVWTVEKIILSGKNFFQSEMFLAAFKYYAPVESSVVTMTGEQ